MQPASVGRTTGTGLSPAPAGCQPATRPIANRRYGIPLALALLTFFLVLPRLAAQGPLVTIQPPAGDRVALDYPSAAEQRFILLTGLSVDAIATPVATNEGRAGLDRFTVSLEPDLPAGFFRLLVQDAPPASTNLPSAALNVSARPGVVFAPAADRGVAFIAPVDLVLSLVQLGPPRVRPGGGKVGRGLQPRRPARRDGATRRRGCGEHARQGTTATAAWATRTSARAGWPARARS